MPDHDRHVTYTRYLGRILAGKVTNYTTEEQQHAQLVAAWLKEPQKCEPDPVLAQMEALAWESEPSLRKPKPVKK